MRKFLIIFWSFVVGLPIIFLSGGTALAMTTKEGYDSALSTIVQLFTEACKQVIKLFVESQGI